MNNGSWVIYYKLTKENDFKMMEIIIDDVTRCKNNLILAFLYVVYV